MLINHRSKFPLFLPVKLPAAQDRKRKVAELQSLLQDGCLEEVAKRLLRDYYDVLYQYPEGPEAGYDLCVNSEDVEGRRTD